MMKIFLEYYFFRKLFFKKIKKKTGDTAPEPPFLPFYEEVFSPKVGTNWKVTAPKVGTNWKEMPFARIDYL